jgi:hypothetical protein
MFRLAFWVFAICFFGWLAMVVTSYGPELPASSEPAAPLAAVETGPTPEELAEKAEREAFKRKMEEQYAAADAAREAKRPKMNAVNYAKIQMGMSYDDVVAIVGNPTEELSRTEMAGTSAVVFMWRSGFIGNATIMFQDGKAVTKSQAWL